MHMSGYGFCGCIIERRNTLGGKIKPTPETTPIVDWIWKKGYVY